MPDVLSYLLEREPTSYQTKLHRNKECKIDSVLCNRSKFGDVKITHLLLKNSADFNIIRSNKTPLMIASENGHLDVVKLLINAGANTNAYNSKKQTALMFAASGDQLKVMGVLIDNGAKLSLKDVNSSSALMHSTLYGRFRAASLLLKRGSKFDDIDRTEMIGNILRYGASKVQNSDAWRYIDFSKYKEIEWRNAAICSLEIFISQFYHLKETLASTGFYIDYAYKANAEVCVKFFAQHGYKMIANLLQVLDNYPKKVKEPSRFALLFALLCNAKQEVCETSFRSKMIDECGNAYQQLDHSILSEILKSALALVSKNESSLPCKYF